MRLYEFLNENLGEDYNWEDYTYEETDIQELKGNQSLLCEIWDAINDWADEFADNCKGTDAALIVRILNETISLINQHTSSDCISLSSAADLCSIYGRCCVFAKNLMCGSEFFEKCKFVVNNTIANCIICKKQPDVELSDVDECDPEEDCWEEL